ncbi:hypothetical protein [Sphingomicrobium arenosum]|uniref:hypothetical protein n=1 Tax=Sphingomicrobium arenosum TaxID=2233861 RepID=UPI002240B907|nr:hypothetical protein [Sphingomicrobium arenosum]
MLLRRVMDHVRNQNWFAVLLDFIIVVVGVFIGIQVANWNEARVDKKREQAALSNLLTQTEANVAYSRLILHRNAKLQEDREAAMAMLADKEPVSGDPNDGLALLSLLRDFTPRYNFYDELMSSGDVVLIGSEELRQEQSLILGIDRFNDRWRAEAVERMPDILSLARAYLTLDLDGPEGQPSVVAVDWAAARQDDALVDAATRAMASQRWWIGRLKGYREGIENFCDLLGETVGRDCAPPDWVAEDIARLDEESET